MTLPNKRTAVTLCLALVALYFGQNVSTTSIKGQNILTSLIKSGGRLDSLVFQNPVVQPDVLINGTEVMKCPGGSCIVGTSLVLSPDFCSPATYVTLYLGNPPSPQNFTGSELCARFPHVEPTRESEENNHLAYGIPISIIIVILLVPGNILTIILLLYSYCKNRSHTKEKGGTGIAEHGTDQQLRRSACFTKLTELFDEVCFCTTPNKPWKCPCEKPCLLTQPMLFNYDSKSYVLFAVENEAEKSICINPHLEKYQQYFHVANVFAVYMDNVDAATSADDLRVWYKESGKWDRSLLKDKVFLHMSASHPSPSGNSASRFMDKVGEIQAFAEVPEAQVKALTDPTVQDMLTRQQTARFSDYHVSEENVRKTVDAVTGEDPDKTATVLGNTIIRRNPSSRSMARTDGGELYENTASQGDTPKFFTGEQDEYKTIDNDETEC